jgi:hypothetical protein
MRSNTVQSAKVILISAGLSQDHDETELYPVTQAENRGFLLIPGLVSALIESRSSTIKIMDQSIITIKLGISLVSVSTLAVALTFDH